MKFKFEMKRLFLGLFVLGLFISLVRVGSAEILTSDAGVEYESEILDELDNVKWVMAIVEIHFEDEILLNLTENEFILEKKLLGGYSFFGNITLEGLNKLIDNSNVALISRSIVGYPTNNLAIPVQNFCELDSDCEIVSKTCCGCSVASLSTPIEDLLVAIRSDEVDLWNENLIESCSGIACIQGSTGEQVEKCNSYEPKCVNNECVISNIAEQSKDEINSNKINLVWIVVIVVLAILIKD